MNPQPSFRFKLFSILAVLLLISTCFNWSMVRAGGEEWRTLDPAELALKAAKVEPNADAEAIFWDIEIDDGGYSDLVLSHYVRIKIFNERGREKHSKMDIPYVNGVKIKDIAARTIKADGSIETGDIRTQSTCTLESLKASLEKAGSSLADVIHLTIYLTDMAERPVFNEVYCAYFKKPYPVRCAVGVSALADPGMRVEVTAMAVSIIDSVKLFTPNP